MKIAQVAPLMESVPPKGYGGTERVVSWLTEELVHQGHEVTLFASGDSVTSAELVPGSEKGLRLAGIRDPLPLTFVMMKKVMERADEFDVIHFHTDYMHFTTFYQQSAKTVTTLHGRLDLDHLPPIFDAFPEMPLVSISDYQRLPLPNVNWVDTVYHGLPKTHMPYCANPKGDYLAFLGRICPEKGVDHAVNIAKRVGMKLKVAAKIDPADTEYYEGYIKPILDDPIVEFIGEIGDEQKPEFLGNAHAVLFPIQWPEPFGLVMIESMSCGAPVIAYRRGSVPEVIEHGLTGMVVNSEDEAVKAVYKSEKLDRALVRQRFEERFSAERMAAGYCDIYANGISAFRRS